MGVTLAFFQLSGMSPDIQGFLKVIAGGLTTMS